MRVERSRGDEIRGWRRELLQATSAAVGWGSARWSIGSLNHGGQAPSRSQVVEWPAAVARPTSTAPPPLQCTNASSTVKWRELPTVSGGHRTCNRQRRYQVSADYGRPRLSTTSPPPTGGSYPAARPCHGSVPTSRPDDILSQRQRAGRIRCHCATQLSPEPLTSLLRVLAWVSRSGRTWRSCCWRFHKNRARPHWRA